jgi:hypothetical protein
MLAKKEGELIDNKDKYETNELYSITRLVTNYSFLFISNAGVCCNSTLDFNGNS